ncbi:class 1 isoprenoid biosynthesis enzyme [Streptomyces sp. AK02-01A]|uniref:class 1 isoprenoid biosynthesis enzyme n=1 Tax=Streptomyces sp. AK02-01A TaxID=3028648 RepID=UPI0029A6FE4A|nr:class 1 isoprenoid biosynthesis enzyme [Streptomyces sp. AK02-01A]MDX3852346.1 class 1 isoprenoid biosynthesis enzyme [Streptomyces sp. AK02-01A]
MSAALPADYTAAMLVTEGANRDRVTAFVAATGGSPDLTAHVAALRLYLRVPHFLTEWITDAPLRARVSAGLALDIVAMKLLDDLMDDDTGLNRIELACTALRLHLTALRELCEESGDAQAVVDLLEHDFTTVCTGQIRTKRHRARDLEQWCANASTYGATFLGCYGALAALCGRRPEWIGPARSFAEAFGTIITIADDLTDYDRDGERDGNLGHLMRTGDVRVQDVTDLLEKLRAQALGAVREQPVSHGLVAVVDLYTDDVLDRLLPVHARG